MKIGCRGGHSKKCIGAVGIVNEYEQMQKFFVYVKNEFEKRGHIVIDCNSNGNTANAELSEGANKANNNNVDLFISLHMNAFDGQGHGTECVISSTSSASYAYAQRICNSFATLGFTNRGVKCQKLYEMNHISAPNIIFEICFCDSQTDIDIFNKYSWEQLAKVLCDAVENKTSKISERAEKKYYVVTNYLPVAFNEYNGVDIKPIIDKYFSDIKCYVRWDNKGIWLETQYISKEKCEELKEFLGSGFYKIKED